MQVVAAAAARGMKTKWLNMNKYIRKMVVCCCSTQIIIESTALRHRMNFYCLVCRKIRHRGHNLTQLEVSFELRDQEFILHSICTRTHTVQSMNLTFVVKKSVYIVLQRAHSELNAVHRYCVLTITPPPCVPLASHYFIIATETHSTSAVSVNRLWLDTNQPTN